MHGWADWIASVIASLARCPEHSISGSGCRLERPHNLRHNLRDSVEIDMVIVPDKPIQSRPLIDLLPESSRPTHAPTVILTLGKNRKSWRLRPVIGTKGRRFPSNVPSSVPFEECQTAWSKKLLWIGLSRFVGLPRLFALVKKGISGTREHGNRQKYQDVLSKIRISVRSSTENQTLQLSFKTRYTLFEGSQSILQLTPISRFLRFSRGLLMASRHIRAHTLRAVAGRIFDGDL